MTLRHLLSWKSLFYDALLPALRRLGPARGDALLGNLGRLAAAWPPRRKALTVALERGRVVLGVDWPLATTRPALAANVARYLARDYPLDGLPDAAMAERFDVQGFEHVENARGQGRGVILLGSHLGAHLASIHWLYRQNLTARLLVQRPRHVSHDLQRWFDRAEGPLPQSEFFLRRGLPPAEAARRVLRARDALRAGMIVYLNGDIPWKSTSARDGRLLGRSQPFLAFWADLAVLSKAPVVPVFCRHQPGGRYVLRFDPPWHLTSGGETEAVTRYLSRLEHEIRAHPAEAVPYLTWPCYAPPAPRHVSDPAFNEPRPLASQPFAR